MRDGNRTAPKDIDEYLACIPPDQRTALEDLRRIIREAAPDAVEAISYQVPTFKHHGGLVGFAAFKKHCTFFVMSSSLLSEFQDEVAGYPTSTGGIRFQPESPLPVELVTKLVKARVAENEKAVKA